MSASDPESQLKLVWKQENGDIVEFNLMNDEAITIGRMKSNTIHLTDPLVSGYHCAIQNGYIVDRGSTNGTQLNGQHLKKGDPKFKLKAKDKVLCGDTVFVVERGMAKAQQDEEEYGNNHQDWARTRRLVVETSSKESNKHQTDEIQNPEVSELKSDIKVLHYKINQLNAIMKAQQRKLNEMDGKVDSLGDLMRGHLSSDSSAAASRTKLLDGYYWTLCCPKCNTKIQSHSVHDCQYCPCQTCFIDGGREYMRCGGDMDPKKCITQEPFIAKQQQKSDQIG